MHFNDEELLRNGNIDFDYAYKWLNSLKDIYDISDVLKDKEDIRLIFEVYNCNEILMYKKFQELMVKYSAYVALLNFAMNWKPRNNSKLNVKEQLMMFYDYLPVLWLMKFGVVKVFNKMAENRLLSCAG